MVGAGMIGLEGAGSLSHVSIHHKPDIFREPMMFGALHVKGSGVSRVLEGPVPRWKAFGQPTATVTRTGAAMLLLGGRRWVYQEPGSAWLAGRRPWPTRLPADVVHAEGHDGDRRPAAADLRPDVPIRKRLLQTLDCGCRQ